MKTTKEATIGTMQETVGTLRQGVQATAAQAMVRQAARMAEFWWGYTR